MRRAGSMVRFVPLVMATLLATAGATAETARGTVFEDLDGDGLRGAGEPGIAGVAVSNGLDVVRTAEDGSYELTVENGTVLFVTKPPGYSVPTSGHGLPRFYYIHQPEGSAQASDLRYRGVDPSGPLPAAVDFPLSAADEPSRFTVLLLADPQPQTRLELGYFRDDVIDELVGDPAAFGITLGDIVYDDLSLYPRYVRILSRIGIPWYHLPGNHDINALAPDDRGSLETFKRWFGPGYYSFDYGQAHFVVFDNVVYLGSDAGQKRPHPRGHGLYEGHIPQRQLDWLSNDLALVPRDRLVVLLMHIPFTSYNLADNPRRRVDNRRELFDRLAGFENVFALAGHMHTTEHHYFGRDEGYPGAQPLHQHVIATASGSWWGGPFDERGIPTTDQRDGAPNGYHLMTIDGTSYSVRFQAAGKPAQHQMRVMLDSSYHRYHQAGIRDYRMGQLLGSPIDQDQAHSTEVVVNLFDGGPRSTLSCRIDDGAAREMTRVHRPDPFIEELFLRNEATRKPWVEAEPSSHIWSVRLPAGIAAGAHTLTVTATDEYGRTHTAHKVFEVVAGAESRPD